MGLHVLIMVSELASVNAHIKLRHHAAQDHDFARNSDVWKNLLRFVAIDSFRRSQTIYLAADLLQNCE